MDSLKNEMTINKILDRVVLIALIAQIGFILYMNLFRADTIIDYDSSSAYMHEIEMGSQGKIFPSEYSYQSSLDLDSASLISAFLYRFTGDIFLARGITNSLVVFLYIYVINCILSKLNISATWKRFGILLFLIPYSMIMLGYWRMLFVGGGFFAFRALVPLLMISLIQDMNEKKGFSKYAFRAVLLLVIVFLTGLSSGAYIAMSAVCPLFLWEIVNGFIKGDYTNVKSKRTAMAALLVVASMVGIAIQKFWGFSTTADVKYILTSSKWINAVFASFAGLFELFGGLTIHEQVKLFSAEAVGTAVDFVVTWILIAAIIYTIVKCIKKKEISDMKGYIFSLMFVNAMMFCFLDLKYGETVFESRYHIIPMLPSFILVAMMMDDIQKSERLNRVQINTIVVVVMGIFAASMLYGDAQWVYAKTALESDKLKELNGILEDEGVNTAFIVGDDSKVLGRKLRVYGRDTHYIVLNDGAKSPWQTTWGGTTRYLDNSMQSGKTAVIASQDAYETLPDYLISDMTYLMEYEGLQIYVANESRFDCVGGIVPEKNMVVDYSYSPNYTYDNAGIDEEGVLVMNEGGGVLEGSYDSALGKWEYTVYYDMSETNEDAFVEIKTDDAISAHVALDPTVGFVKTEEIDMQDGQKVDFLIVAPEGTKISKIEISRK